MRAAEVFLSHVDVLAAERCFHFKLRSNIDWITEVMVRVAGAPGECSEAEAFAAAQSKLVTAIETPAILERAGSELWRIPSLASATRH